MRFALNKPAELLRFRTNAAGDIPLRSQWDHLLRALAANGEWFIQNRAPGARLIARTRLPAWRFAPPDRAVDPHGVLHFDLCHWQHAVARLELCPCCGSPGYVEIFNAAGEASVQFRAPAALAVETLATLIAPFAAPTADAPAAPPRRGPVLQPVFRREDYPCATAAAFPRFLARCGALGLPLLWRVLNAGSDHRRIFCPVSVETEAGVLTVADGTAHSFQLRLAAAVALVLEPGRAGPLVHVLGADDTLLLTLTAAPGDEASPLWSDALADLFPRHIQP